MQDPITVLNDAEQLHLLDMPQADPFQRGAAALLDSIMAYLLGSGVEHAGNAIYSHITNLQHTLDTYPILSESIVTTFIKNNALVIVNFGKIGCKVSFLIFAFGWLVSRFGGSPAKLLLGLRIVDQKAGKPLSVNQALLRQTMAILMLPGLSFSFYRKDKMALHDILTATSVRKVHGVK